jgi:diguanylate cyclase
VQNMDIKRLKEMGSSCSVLYVEDEADLAAQAIDFLRKIFAVVIHAANGSEGLATYKQGVYDLVITDILMPQMNGIEMSRQIRQINGSQVIIVVSAHKDMNDMIDVLNIGVDGYLLKPVSYENLINELGRTLKNIVARKENIRYQKELVAMVEEKTAELKKRYITDELTGLYNRAYLGDELENAHTKTLLLLDIDNFGFFNDSYGLLFGDKIIKEVAKRLAKNIPPEAILFRVGGDEFAIVLEDKDEKIAFELALWIRAYFAEEDIEMDGVVTKLTFTIGIDSGRGIQMLKNAGMSIKEIRQLGKNRVQVYRPNSTFEQLQNENIRWIDRIKNGIQSELFIPYYQPIVEVSSGKIVKYESLARLSENGEIISPAKFLPPAKMAGLIPGITRQIVNKSFQYHQGTDVSFSVNIADYDLKEGYLVAFLEQKIERYGIDPSRVILEILESISVEDTKDALDQLRAIKKLGFKLAIDDFGTESSNFSRILDLDVDIIKIDGCFIKYIDTDKSSQKITESIVAFARSIGAEVVAEFVHNKAVLDKITELGIEYAQGYYFSEPKPTIIQEGQNGNK